MCFTYYFISNLQDHAIYCNELTTKEQTNINVNYKHYLHLYEKLEEEGKFNSYSINEQIPL